MMEKFFTALGRLYRFLISLVVALLLGVSTWVSWQYYQESLRQNEFVKEGQLISVRVTEADHQQRSWRDMMGNVVYLTFTYQGKTYSCRYTMERSYVGEGDRVSLLYHAGYDACQQPGSEVKFDRSTRKSRLIEWTTIRDFTNQNRLLLLCLLLSTAAFFFISGVIVTISPIPFLSDIARFVFVVELVAAAVFFTYDVGVYFNYYQHLKSTGLRARVLVKDTDRISHGRRSTSRWYDYQATIQYKRGERVMPISEADYLALKPGDSLNVFYDDSVDDLMSIDYGPDYSLVILPIFFWLLSFLFIRPIFVRPKKVTYPS